MEPNLLSIVVPLFNEEGNLEGLYKELLDVCSRLQTFNDVEFIFVNDGSFDQSLQILKQLAHNDPRVKIISFTRNFGHEAATLAGLRYATGDAVVLIDADRQDPPDAILEFEKEMLHGYHIVFGQRAKRLGESWFKKVTSHAFYPFFRWITGVDMPRNVGDFCMLSRKAVELIKQFDERAVFIRGLIYWIGLPKKAVSFIRRGRAAGCSKYNYTKLLVFALENIVCFSVFPIHIIIITSMIIGIISAGLLLGLGLLSLIKMASLGLVPWIALLLCMFFSVIIASVGLIGLYAAKALQEGKRRPVFLIDEVVNVEKK